MFWSLEIIVCRFSFSRYQERNSFLRSLHYCVLFVLMCDVNSVKEYTPDIFFFSFFLVNPYWLYRTPHINTWTPFIVEEGYSILTKTYVITNLPLFSMISGNNNFKSAEEVRKSNRAGKYSFLNHCNDNSSIFLEVVKDVVEELKATRYLEYH